MILRMINNVVTGGQDVGRHRFRNVAIAAAHRRFGRSFILPDEMAGHQRKSGANALQHGRRHRGMVIRPFHHDGTLQIRGDFLDLADAVRPEFVRPVIEGQENTPFRRVRAVDDSRGLKLRPSRRGREQAHAEQRMLNAFNPDQDLVDSFPDYKIRVQLPGQM
jgi:hypothetical protein